MVLDTARPRYKDNSIWLGMRGRDAARKSTPKVNILQVFTIDFSEIQFIVNHNSQSDGQNRSAKSGMNLRKRTIHFNSLQRKREDTKDTGIFFLNKTRKNGPMKLRSDSQSRCHNEKSLTPRIRRTRLKSPSIQVSKDAYDEDKRFSQKITCPTLELINIQDGNIGLQLQVLREGTNPNGVGSEFHTIFFARISFFYSWFRLQLIAIHCNRRGVWTEHFHTRIFSHICTLILCAHAFAWLKVLQHVSL